MASQSGTDRLTLPPVSVMSTSKSDERTTPSMTRAAAYGQPSEFSSLLASLGTYASSARFVADPDNQLAAVLVRRSCSELCAGRLFRTRRKTCSPKQHLDSPSHSRRKRTC